jgi:hypothetical protein
MRRAVDISDSAARLTFFLGNASIGLSVDRHWREPGRSLVTFIGPFVSRLSVVTAYAAFAFVGAIVLGVI